MNESESIDVVKVIKILSSKIAALVEENAVLLAQLEQRQEQSKKTGNLKEKQP